MTSYIDRTFEFIKTQQNAFLERMNITDEMLETMSEHVGLSTKEMADLKEKIEKSKYKEKVYACYCGAQYENLEELQDHQLVHKQEQQERSDTQKRISVKIKTKEELIMGVVDAIASKREKSRYLINRTDWSDEKISEQIGTPSHTIASVRKEVEKLNEEKMGQRTKIVEVPDVVEEQKDNNLDYEI